MTGAGVGLGFLTNVGDVEETDATTLVFPAPCFPCRGLTDVEGSATLEVGAGSTMEADAVFLPCAWWFLCFTEVAEETAADEVAAGAGWTTTLATPCDLAPAFFASSATFLLSFLVSTARAKVSFLPCAAEILMD